MKRVAIVVIAMTLAAIARADFAAGVRAYERGALAEAFEQFKALAQSGMAKAQQQFTQALEPFENARVHKLALSDEIGTATFHVSAGAGSRSCR